MKDQEEEEEEEKITSLLVVHVAVAVVISSSSFPYSVVTANELSCSYTMDKLMIFIVIIRNNCIGNCC